MADGIELFLLAVPVIAAVGCVLRAVLLKAFAKTQYFVVYIRPKGVNGFRAFATKDDK